MAPRVPSDGSPPGPPEGPGDGAGASKRALVEASLEKGRTLVYLDARRAGVHVPERFRDDHQLALALSWRFGGTEMVINERGIAATLRFGGVPFRCVLPWAAVWGMMPAGADQPLVWPHDLPEEFGGSASEEVAGEPPPVEPVRPRLSVVAGGGADEPDADAATSEPPRPRGEAAQAPPGSGDAAPAGTPAAPAEPGSGDDKTPKGRPRLRLVR